MTNLEIIKKSYAAGAAGNPPEMVADLSETGTWTEMAGAPYAGTFVGPQAILDNVFMPMGRDWAPFACEPVDFYECGDTIVMVGWYFGKHGTTGKEFRVRVVHLWKLENGKIVSFEQFTDTKLLAEAMK